MRDRQEVAQLLAVANGQTWSELDEAARTSWLHNADEAIKDQLRPEPVATIVDNVLDSFPLVDPSICLACGGKGFREEQHGLVQIQCGFCGGTGKAVEYTGEQNFGIALKSTPDIVRPMELTDDNYLWYWQAMVDGFQVKIEGSSDDNGNTGSSGRSDSPAGSGDTSKSRNRSKSKVSRTPKKRAK